MTDQVKPGSAAEPPDESPLSTTNDQAFEVVKFWDDDDRRYFAYWMSGYDAEAVLAFELNRRRLPNADTERVLGREPRVPVCKAERSIVTAIDALREQATAKLAELGDTPGAVADALKAAGVSGDHTACGCPIAVYLDQVLPQVLTTAVTSSAIGVVVKEDGVYASCSIRTTPAVRGFVLGFEAGEFPQLLKGGDAR